MRRSTATASAVAVAAWTGLALATTAVAATATPEPSAIGNEMVHTIAVSPRYLDTGLVVADSTALVCAAAGPSCVHLWISHDGGSTWHRAAAQGWELGSPVIAVGRDGHERLYTSGQKGLQYSDDYGDTWVDKGPGGVPTPMPSYAHDGAVAVASGGTDSIVRGNDVSTVQGSGGAYADFRFSFVPGFPGSPGGPPAFLSVVDKKSAALLVESCNASLSCGSPAALAGATATMGSPAQLRISPAYGSDHTIFAFAVTTGLYKSSDSGRTFVPLPIGVSGASTTEVPAADLSPHYGAGDHTVVAAVLQLVGTGTTTHTAGGIYRSNDGGTTWQTVGSPGLFDHGANAVAMAPDGRIFGGYVKDGATVGLLCNTGGAWQVRCPSVGHFYPASTTCAAHAACPGGNAQADAAQASASAQPSAGSGGANANGGDSGGGSAGGLPAGAAGAHDPPGSSRTLLLPAVALGVAALLGAGAFARRRLPRASAAAESRHRG